MAEIEFRLNLCFKSILIIIYFISLNELIKRNEFNKLIIIIILTS